MLSEIKKSINSVMYERVKSPLFGTFILSWTVWNWRIFYISFFIDKSVIPNKLDFIHKYLYNQSHWIWYPLISTIILLTVIPFINNAAYWLHITFRKWRIDQRNAIEMKQLLTIEQSIALREEILVQEEKFEKLLSSKNLEIKQLTQIIDETKGKSTNLDQVEVEDVANVIYPKDLVALSNRIKGNKKESQELENVIFHVQNGHRLTGRSDTISTKFIALLESHDVISAKGNGIYQFTSMGKKFLRLVES